MTATANAVAEQLRRAYELLRARFGHQHWWPGDTAFEVCVGAILTQNTNWANVERAITNLKTAGVLTPRKLYLLPEHRLAALIRPAGYYNVKTKRLRAFLTVLIGFCSREHGAPSTAVHRFVSTRVHEQDLCSECVVLATGRHVCLERLFAGETAVVRKRLLAIPGIGPETADSMLLYAGDHLSFVVDAYTRRIFDRHGWLSGIGCKASYDELKELCESALCHKPKSELLDYWQDYHAQLVVVGKKFCRARIPLCQSCPLAVMLRKKPAATQRHKSG